MYMALTVKDLKKKHLRINLTKEMKKSIRKASKY